MEVYRSFLVEDADVANAKLNEVMREAGVGVWVKHRYTPGRYLLEVWFTSSD